MSNQALDVGARVRVIAVRGLEIEVRGEPNGMQIYAERRAAAPAKQSGGE